METSRRGLLKLFGIGAVVTPLVNGEPLREASARLLEAPKVELFTPSQAALYTDGLRYSSVRSISMSFDMQDGSVIRFCTPVGGDLHGEGSLAPLGVDLDMTLSIRGQGFFKSPQVEAERAAGRNPMQDIRQVRDSHLVFGGDLIQLS